MAAADILDALRALGYTNATLEVIGRAGWGEDWSKLAGRPGVTLHGYQSAERVKEILERMQVPSGERKNWPVLEWQGEIVWIRGMDVESQSQVKVITEDMS